MSGPTEQLRGGRSTAVCAVRTQANTVWKTARGGDATDADETIKRGMQETRIVTQG